MPRWLTLFVLASVVGPKALEAEQKRPKFPIVDPPVRVYFSVSDAGGPQEASTLQGRLKAIRKELDPRKKKEWRWDWWLQLVDRPEDAEVQVALEDYERRILGGGYQDNLFLTASMKAGASGYPTRVVGRALERDNASLEQRFLQALCDALQPYARDRIK